MDPIRLFSIISWILLPTVMFGGYSLLGLMARGNTWLTPFRGTYFRAGHAHAGVLLVLSLVYYTYLAQTTFSASLKVVACSPPETWSRCLARCCWPSQSCCSPTASSQHTFSRRRCRGREKVLPFTES